MKNWPFSTAWINNNVFNLLVKQIYEKKSTNAIFEESYSKKSGEHDEINIFFAVD
ncbi:hypothetical protein CE91St24_29630 [Odoribacteraceae bacterium]|nr:hypothetical protein CE91St21_06870 [Odoribacteraceae bacterium]GKH92191.1 hypothetical protein CE91St23_06870 [Odoribacteraceae bacterium]GKH96809.1 hypothetical protein CE91St22_06870 [Odoribacteraceae bacterium]GKI03688.1 hypothetical protein CE91St24_29630 [Odoribacteraceae bacterium]